MSRPVRRISGAKNQIFLTFDDGPSVYGTEKVLEILDQYSAKATFFCIAQEAKNNRSLFNEIVKRGHAIGNHSLDHNFSNFFASQKILNHWIQSSHGIFRDDLGIEPVGFRSPAGVVTPPLTRALAELNIPLIHWNRRFFDTSVPIGWMKSFHSYEAGDILLLHDKQRPWLRNNFYKNLPRLMDQLGHKGFDFSALSKENFVHER